MKRRTPAFIATLISTVAWQAACTDSRASQASQDTTAAPAAAVQGDTANANRVLATGNIRLSPGSRIEVGAQISGRVRRLLVTQGSRVEAGQVIAELDAAEARAVVAQASAQVNELAAQELQARDQVKRAEALAAADGVTQQDLLAAHTAATQATARLEAGRATAELARVRLGYATIRAPIRGIVGSVTTHEGETVAASLATPTFVTLIDPSRLDCVALVDETDIGRVAVGDSAEFTVDAYPGRVFHAVAERIAPDATIVGGVVDYEVTLRLRGSTAGLKPQMTASVTILHTTGAENMRGLP